MNNQINSTPPIFREEQPFRQVWFWLVILFTAGLFWYALISQIFLNRPFGNKPAPDALLIIFWLVFGLGLPVAAFYTRLITEVRGDGLYIRFIPFHRSFRKIPFADIQQAETRTYRPIREYGGWGIRFGPHGRAYNVSGNRGVQLVLAGGKRLLIGSQQPDALLQAILAGKQG